MAHLILLIFQSGFRIVTQLDGKDWRLVCGKAPVFHHYVIILNMRSKVRLCRRWPPLLLPTMGLSSAGCWWADVGRFLGLVPVGLLRSPLNFARCSLYYSWSELSPLISWRLLASVGAVRALWSAGWFWFLKTSQLALVVNGLVLIDV
jgi:hypothetical protein